MSRLRLITLLVLLALCVFSVNNSNAQDMPTRYPLLELFTNTPCPICGNQDPGFFSRLENYEGQYHHVSFYPGSPYSSCVFYQANTTENRARRDFYPQIVGSPDVALNGIDFKSPNSVTTSVLDDLTGGTSWLSVQVSETAGVERDVTITLENHGGASVESGTLFAVIVEKEIMYEAPNGIDLHHNVFRKFLTPVDGETVDVSGDVLIKTYEYSVDLDWQFDQTYIVAWVMDPETKEIINSGTKFDEVVSSTGQIISREPLAIYPNPVSDQLQIHTPAGSGGQLRVFDSAGRLMHQEDVFGDAIITLSVTQWAEGMYVAEVVSDDLISRGRFNVVK